MKITFGSDVEFAAIKLGDSSELPVLVPPSLLEYEEKMQVLGYNGDETHPIYLDFGEGRFYRDGALFETDFKPTQHADVLFDRYIKSKEHLDRFLEPLGLQSWTKPVAKFDVELMKGVPDEWVYEACIAGCSPDEDMIDDDYPSGVVRDLTDWPVRGLGAHLHMSLPKEYGGILHKLKKPIVRMLACTVGNMGIYTSDSIDLERVRREKFGSPGKCRFPTYSDDVKGVEYRPLSPTWLRTPEIVEMTLESAEFAITTAIELPKETQEILDFYLPKSVTAINNVLPKLSKKILKSLELI